MGGPDHTALRCQSQSLSRQLCVCFPLRHGHCHLSIGAPGSQAELVQLGFQFVWGSETGVVREVGPHVLGSHCRLCHIEGWGLDSCHSAVHWPCDTCAPGTRESLTRALMVRVLASALVPMDMLIACDGPSVSGDRSDPLHGATQVDHVPQFVLLQRSEGPWGWGPVCLHPGHRARHWDRDPAGPEGPPQPWLGLAG